MNKLIAATLVSLAPLSVAVAGSPDKEHPPQKATEEATPEMKNPDGTEKLHPPQKAMDEATPVEKKDSGAAKDTGGANPGKMVAAPDWDQRKAGEGINLKAGK